MWYAGCTVESKRDLHWVVKTAHGDRLQKDAWSFSTDTTYPGYSLFFPLLSGKRYPPHSQPTLTRTENGNMQYLSLKYTFIYIYIYMPLIYQLLSLFLSIFTLFIIAVSCLCDSACFFLYVSAAIGVPTQFHCVTTMTIKLSYVLMYVLQTVQKKRQKA